MRIQNCRRTLARIEAPVSTKEVQRPLTTQGAVAPSGVLLRENMLVEYGICGQTTEFVQRIWSFSTTTVLRLSAELNCPNTLSLRDSDMGAAVAFARTGAI
eukprot:COSAG02_NODE_1337_length_13193_cov_9.142050_4_plen_101_part_00